MCSVSFKSNSNSVTRMAAMGSAESSRRGLRHQLLRVARRVEPVLILLLAPQEPRDPARNPWNLRCGSSPGSAGDCIGEILLQPYPLRVAGCIGICGSAARTHPAGAKLQPGNK